MSGSEGPGETREQALARLKQSAADELDKLFDEATIQAREARAKTVKELPSVEVVNYGRIAYMRLPAGWQESAPPAPSGEADKRRLREFHVPSEPEINIRFFYRGHKLAEADAESFRSALAKPAHVLSPAEIKALSEVLRDKAEGEKFRVLVIATRDLNGQRVLVAEGRYLDTQTEVYALHIDVDGTGRIVQEIFFQSPQAEYARYFAQARSAFKTIQWR